jgi:hypothetical protein
MSTRWLAVLIAGASVCSGSASATAEPVVAVVEQVIGNLEHTDFMDYVEAGKIIRLGAHDSVVLSYLRSCTRETITGGMVIVGIERSEVRSGKVERTRFECDGGRMELTSEQANQFSGRVFRGPAKPITHAR